MVEDHSHNGTDSRKLVLSESVEGLPQESIDEVTGTADGTYSANEQTLLNDLVTTVNEILTKLRNSGIIK